MKGTNRPGLWICLLVMLALAVSLRCGMAQIAPATVRAQSEAVRAGEMAMLHIAALRNCNRHAMPGTPQFAAVATCDAANFDEARANPWPLPDPLVMADGSRVTSASAWWKQRRPQLLEIFDREIFGRIPAGTPGVKWHAGAVVHEKFGAVAVVTTKFTGHVDNGRDPAITVDIKMNISVPEVALGRPMPAILALTFLGPRTLPLGITQSPDPAPDYREQIVRRGWALVAYDNTSVQPDNGAGLNAGIIGLMNKGGPRKPDDWGALQAWGWGASRILDYLGTDPDIDAHRVAIFGHSRNGKAALVAMAHDQRFALGFISSSGAGGAAPYRRNYGESIANIENPGLFHWLAPNFLKYAAVGVTPNEVPVETNELIALCAPRPLFLSGGTSLPAPVNGSMVGDLWTDPVGSFKAAVAAGAVYRLLGVRGLSRDTMPAMLTLVDGGNIAFRQHEQGHTSNPNWSYFLDFAQRQFAH
jgi:hypothetical protein